MKLKDPDLILSYRFGVFFFEGGVQPNMVDIRFQKVSGLRADMTMGSITEGGENLYTHRIPKRADYGNLILERGIVIKSSVQTSFNDVFTFFKFSPASVLVTVYNDQNKPATGWLFHKAFPVKWSFGDLDANASSVIIETMELAYTMFQNVEV
ncbi:phage tail protein [Mucilaginibacter sp. cycad4]|uniref:phage tail protein n=1 Tax=Mucilaginibacter sp. cycad4 TaxID=3342096 RepID=UPI002AAA888D|nr:phage tail protein [Mucilaginibacter gossypii]WPV01745.1 phage tail protein [Mucilaginibacter gossypii]